MMDSVFRNDCNQYLNSAVYCMCNQQYLQGINKERELSHDFMSLFLEKNSDGTKNLRLKGNELEYRIRRRVKDKDMPKVADFITKNPTIISIDLSYNPISDNGLKVLLEGAFKRDNKIQHLNLTGCDITGFGLQLLCNSLSTIVLKTLRLTGNKIGDKEAELFDSLLSINSTLEQLDVANTDQTIRSIPHFCSALRCDIGDNTTLKILDLSNVIPISIFYQCQPTKLCEHLSRMLELNSTLLELHLQKCGLDGHCIEMLLMGLRKNSTLLLLDLGFNRINNYGAELLADWFKSRPELIGLNIAGNSIGELGARALSFGVPYSKLRLLDLSQNKINDQGISEVVLSIKKSQRIRLFFIFGNEIGPLSKEILERQLMAGVYEQSNIDFQMFHTTEGLKVARYSSSNDYKHKLYNQLDVADVRELRIRRNIIPGPFCARHAKIHFVYYERVDGPDCAVNPRYDPDKLNEEALREHCLELERIRKEQEQHAPQTSILIMPKKESHGAKVDIKRSECAHLYDNDDDDNGKNGVLTMESYFAMNRERKPSSELKNESRRSLDDGSIDTVT